MSAYTDELEGEAKMLILQLIGASGMRTNSVLRSPRNRGSHPERGGLAARMA